MNLTNLMGTLETHSVILSREIAKLEDVYSLVDLVEEKLRLDVSLTLLLLENDSKDKLGKNTVLNIKDEIKDVLIDDVELKKTPDSEVHSDESNENADDPNYKLEYEETTSNTDTKVTTIKIKKQKGGKVGTGGSLCNECGKLYKNSRHLNRHKRAIHLNEKKTYTCPICKKEETYKYYAMFFKHKQICEAKLPENAERYVCSICGAKFGTYYNWKNHHYACSGEKPKRSQSKPTLYKCNFENCGYVGRLKIRLKNHINIVHLNLPEIKDHFCDTCGKSFTEARRLKNHVNTVHLDMRDHTCITCGNSFKSSEMLRRHVKIHSDICSYLCPFSPCEKKFKQSATLYRHKLSCQYNLNKNK